MDKKVRFSVITVLAAVGVVILILHLLGADPIGFAFRNRYVFLNFVFLIVIVGALLWIGLKRAGRKLSDAYSGEPRLIQQHLQDARKQIDGTDPGVAQERSQSWESMPDAQKELFVSTYLEDRYRKRDPADLSKADRDLLGKAYWYSLGSEE